MHMHTEGTLNYSCFPGVFELVWRLEWLDEAREEKSTLKVSSPWPSPLRQRSSCTWADEDLIITVHYAQKGNPFLRVLRKILIIQLMSFIIITFG